MLTCKEVTELASSYLDADLGTLDRMRFRLHLAMCRHCRNYVAQLRETVVAIRRAPVADGPPAEVPPAALDAFRARVSGSRSDADSKST